MFVSLAQSYWQSLIILNRIEVKSKLAVLKEIINQGPKDSLKVDMTHTRMGKCGLSTWES